MSLSQITLRTREVFGNFEKRVLAHVNQERKTINNNLVLDYHVGSTFSIDSHKKDPENCESYPQILNGERGSGINSRLRKGFIYHLDPQQLE